VRTASLGARTVTVLVEVSLLLSRFYVPTMSCCGTPAGKKGADEKNRPYSQYPQQSPINQQPGPQPGLGWQEKPYQPPTIPSPPPTHYSHGLLIRHRRQAVSTTRTSTPGSTRALERNDLPDPVHRPATAKFTALTSSGRCLWSHQHRFSTPADKRLYHSDG
jgi:hypothetical protein